MEIHMLQVPDHLQNDSELFADLNAGEQKVLVHDLHMMLVSEYGQLTQANDQLSCHRYHAPLVCRMELEQVPPDPTFTLLHPPTAFCKNASDG